MYLCGCSLLKRLYTFSLEILKFLSFLITWFVSLMKWLTLSFSSGIKWTQELLSQHQKLVISVDVRRSLLLLVVVFVFIYFCTDVMTFIAFHTDLLCFFSKLFLQIAFKRKWNKIHVWHLASVFGSHQQWLVRVSFQSEMSLWYKLLTSSLNII